MGEHYAQLTLTERCRLRGLKEIGLSNAEIARRLGRSGSTISRELKRNGVTGGAYKPEIADRMAWVRRLRGSKIGRRNRLKRYVEDGLAMGWSPEQIAGRLRQDEAHHRVSHESIYRYIYSRHGRADRLHRYLSQAKARRGRRARKGTREPAIPNRTAIHLRPTKAHLRSQFGHWEGDLMHFRRRHDLLATLIERKTRFHLALPLQSKAAPEIGNAVTALLGGLPKRARRTITYDNGGEFADHERVTQEIGLRAFFCDPHAPWQRGSIENMNGRLRRDLPRKANLLDYSIQDIADIVWSHNVTPRKCLEFKTPLEAFASNLGIALEM